MALQWRTAFPKRFGALVLFGLGLVTSPVQTFAGLDAMIPDGVSAPEASSTKNALSPRKSLLTFLKAVEVGDLDLAKHFVATEKLPLPPMLPTMVRLASVIDKRSEIDPLALSSKPEGAANDDLPADREFLGRIALGDQLVHLQMERITSDKDPRFASFWRIDAESTRQLLVFETLSTTFRLADWVPPYLKYRFFGLELWQWLGILVGVFLAILLSQLVRIPVFWCVNRFWRRYESKIPDIAPDRFMKPIQGLLFILIFRSLQPALNLGVEARQVIGLGERLLLLVFSLWVVRLVLQVGFLQLKLRFQSEDKAGAVALLPSAKVVVQSAVILFGVLIFIENLGYDVTALVAGLGVGGIAIAFAAQKTIENLICGFMILMDQPVKVGEYCRFGVNEGFVERIGLRSTRIRTLERTVVTIPNADFAQLSIENLAERDQIRMRFLLGVRYETSADQMRYILTALNRLLITHEKVSNDKIRVRFHSFADYALNIEIVGYITTSVFDQFLAIREDIYLAIMDIVKEAGTDFAFPSQTIYFERGAGIDKAKAKDVENIVADWKRSNQVPLPSFPDDMRASLANTRRYPPQESWVVQSQPEDAAASSGPKT